MAERQTVLILDFGSQYTQLIARRIRECHVYCEIHPGTLKLEKAKGIRNPTLVLCGALDQTTPPALARALAETIPGARYQEIADSGHCPMLEQPDLLASAAAGRKAAPAFVLAGLHRRRLGRALAAAGEAGALLLGAGGRRVVHQRFPAVIAHHADRGEDHDRGEGAAELESPRSH